MLMLKAALTAVEKLVDTVLVSRTSWMRSIAGITIERLGAVSREKKRVASLKI